MFTGIITDIGEVAKIEKVQEEIIVTEKKIEKLKVEKD